MQKHKSHILLREKLEEWGFSKIESPMYDDSSYFMKQEGNTKLYISAGEIIGNNKFHSIGSWLSIDKIEYPILKIVKKYNQNMAETSTFHTIRFYKLLEPSEQVRKEYQVTLDIELINDIDIENVVNGVLEYLYTVYKPLWEKYSDLQVINDELIEKIPMDKLNEYISGTFFHGKILIIMKKCNNPRYEEFYRKELLSFQESANDEGIKETLRSFKQDPELFSKHFLMFQDLYEGLESGKYLEEVA